VMDGTWRASGSSKSGGQPTPLHSLRLPYPAAGGGRMPGRGRSGLVTRRSSKPTSTTGTRGGLLRQMWSLAKSHPDCSGISDASSRIVVNANRTRRRRVMNVGYARTSTSDQTAGVDAQRAT